MVTESAASPCALAAISDIEGNVFVSLFAAGTAILVPHIHNLTVLDKRSETLTQAVDALADTQ